MSKRTHQKGAFSLDAFSDTFSGELESFLQSVHATDFAFEYLRDEVLSKHPSHGTSPVSPDVRESKAIAKLLAADKVCSQINEEGYKDHSGPWPLSTILFHAKSKIGNLVNDWDQHSIDLARFSNGASIGHKSQDAAPYKKVAGKGSVTHAARHFARYVVRRSPQWAELKCAGYGEEPQWFDVVPGNAIFTVPKNSEIDRAAAKEPSMNMFLQRGVGVFLRERLKLVGIDIPYQQQRNRDLARLGSVDGSLATLDLSAASDSISDRLVWDLLPEDLYSYLCMIRSPRGVFPDGSSHTWSLFATMGNGFTFELETLVFYSICEAIRKLQNVEGKVTVYGDDIIVPTEIAGLCMTYLSALGFTVNDKKSFWEGPFRESCGGHYYNGSDVTPFYVRDALTDVSRLVLLANRLRSWGVVDGVSDPRLYPLWIKVVDKISHLGFAKLLGGSDLDTPLSIASPHPRGYKLQVVQKYKASSRVRTGPYLDYGRLITWFQQDAENRATDLVRDLITVPEEVHDKILYHHDHYFGESLGEITDSEDANLFRLRRDRGWKLPIPLFPQELEVG